MTNLNKPRDKRCCESNQVFGNKGILSKEYVRKISSQKGVFPNSLRPLMTDGLHLIGSVLTPLAKNVLMPVKSTAAASATDPDI